MNRRPANRGAPPDGVSEVSEPDDWDVEGSVPLRSPCSFSDTPGTVFRTGAQENLPRRRRRRRRRRRLQCHVVYQRLAAVVNVRIVCKPS